MISGGIELNEFDKIRFIEAKFEDKFSVNFVQIYTYSTFCLMSVLETKDLTFNMALPDDQLLNGPKSTVIKNVLRTMYSVRHIKQSQFKLVIFA